LNYFKTSYSLRSHNELLAKISAWFNGESVDIKGLDKKVGLNEINQQRIFLEIYDSVERPRQEREEYLRQRKIAAEQKKLQKTQETMAALKKIEEKKENVKAARLSAEKVAFEKAAKIKLKKTAASLIREYVIEPCSVCSGLGHGLVNNLVKRLLLSDSSLLPLNDDYYSYTYNERNESVIVVCDNTSPDCPFCGGTGTFQSKAYGKAPEKKFRCRYCNGKGLMSRNWTRRPETGFINQVLKSKDPSLINEIRRQLELSEADNLSD
jgi:hypothetical protein